MGVIVSRLIIIAFSLVVTPSLLIAEEKSIESVDNTTGSAKMKETLQFILQSNLGIVNDNNMILFVKGLSKKPPPQKLWVVFQDKEGICLHINTLHVYMPHEK